MNEEAACTCQEILLSLCDDDRKEKEREKEKDKEREEHNFEDWEQINAIRKKVKRSVCFLVQVVHVKLEELHLQLSKVV